METLSGDENSDLSPTQGEPPPSPKEHEGMARECSRDEGDRGEINMRSRGCRSATPKLSFTTYMCTLGELVMGVQSLMYKENKGIVDLPQSSYTKAIHP